MKILSRYLFKNLLMPLLYLIAVFIIIFTIADLMDNGEDFLEAHTPIMDILKYYGLRLPSLIIMIVPICLLLAVLYSLSMLTRHNEITAIRASGVSIYRIIRPYIRMGIYCWLFTALVNEYTGPKFAYRADQFLEIITKKGREVYTEEIAFRNQKLRHSWFVARFDTRTYTMHNIKLTIQREDGSDEVQYKAAKGRWMDGRWWFEDVTVQKYDRLGNLLGPAEKFQTLEMRKLQEVPEDFMNEIKDPVYLSSLELWRYIKTHPHLSPKILARYKTDFHHRVSMPFVCLLIVFIGIPVGAHTGRRGVLAGVMTALGMFFAFYTLQYIMIYLAKEMYIAPWMGPWIPIILFFLIACILVYRMR